MDFCTSQDVRTRLTDQRLIDFLDLADGTDLSLEPRIIAAVEYANASVAAAARNQYDAPLTKSTPLLRGMAVDVAVFRLYSGDVSKLSDNDLKLMDLLNEKITKLENGMLDLGLKSHKEENAIEPPAAFSLDGSSNSEIFGKSWLKDW